MEGDRLARLVGQHAETSRLLGVDFVPVFRAGTSTSGVAIDDSAGALVESRVEVKVAPATSAAAAPSPLTEFDSGTPLPRQATARSIIAPATREAKREALDELRARYERDAPHKSFVTSFTNIVFGDGDPAARLAFIGEAPGEEEDRTGKPFVGRAGQLLNKMIAAMGLAREQVYICNVLKTRPPNNATPTPTEVAACAPYLHEQIAIIAPEVIVTLGLPASRLILQTESSMTNMRGRWGKYNAINGTEVPVMPTYHPAYLLRSYTAENRGKVWSDLQLVMGRLGLTPSKAAADPA